MEVGNVTLSTWSFVMNFSQKSKSLYCFLKNIFVCRLSEKISWLSIEKCIGVNYISLNCASHLAVEIFFIYLNQIFSDQLNNKETKISTSLNILTKTIRFRLTKDYAVLTNQARSNLQKESFPHKFLTLRDKTCNQMQ